MTDDDDKNGADLDLGLGALLSTEEEVPTPKEKPALDVDSFIDTFIEARSGTNDDVPVSNLWLNLWQKKAYAQITAEAEKLLAKDSDAVEARLWWIRAHCADATMPISMIAAPAETLLQRHSFEDGKSDSEYQDLFTSTFTELSNSCWEKDLKERSIRFLEAVSIVDNRSIMSLYERVSLEKNSLNLSQLPIAERADAAEYREYLVSLDTALQSAAISIPQDNTTAAAAIDKQKRSDVKKTASTFAFFGVPLKTTAVPIGLASAIVIAGYFGYQKGFQGSSPLHVPVIESSGEGVEVALEIPMPERKQLANGPTLYNILKTLESGDGSTGPLKVSRDPVGVTNRNTSGLVNTSLPVEPPELERLIEAYDQREGVSAKYSSTDLSLDLDVPDPPESQGQNRRSTIVQGYQSIAGIKRESAETSSSGKNERMYLVVDRTPVYAHPSTDAPALAELKVGNHVEVAEILGDWFKIMSAKDRVGYIKSDKAKLLADS